MKRNAIRKLIFKELYSTSLKNLYEADDPAAPPADPAAPAPAADPALAAPADPAAAAAPVADPTIAAPPADPMAAMGGATPPADPMAAMGGAPTPAAGAPPKKNVKAKPPNPNEDPANFKIYSALKKAISSAKNAANESLRRRSLKFLYEADDKKEEKVGSSPDIDMDNFAGSIANLIDNYTSLVDVKKTVIDQADYYLGQEFPNEADALRRQLKDLLRKNYHISLERSEEPKDSYAVGARQGGGGAA